MGETAEGGGFFSAGQESLEGGQSDRKNEKGIETAER